MKTIFILFACLLSVSGFANPPENIEKISYSDWIKANNGTISAFNDQIFHWYEDQLRTALPSAVERDPNKLVIAVDRPIAETIELEDSGDIEAGTTYGMEAYAVVDAKVETALEALLFSWGKPVGQLQGTTYPLDSVFSFRKETIEAKWGPNSYMTTTTKTGGGVANDLHDTFTLLVRGNATDGYVVIGNFLKPLSETATTSHLSIALLKPMSDGRTEFRISGRQTGQNYSFFGVEYGRKNFGFNTKRLRQGQLAFLDTIQSLKKTGKIPENRPRLRRY